VYRALVEEQRGNPNTPPGFEERREVAKKRKIDWTRRTIAGPVKVTHSDGSTEEQPAYGRGKELGHILNRGRKPTPPTGKQPR
jgi:hypothetical protein